VTIFAAKNSLFSIIQTFVAISTEKEMYYEDDRTIINLSKY